MEIQRKKGKRQKATEIQARMTQSVHHDGLDRKKKNISPQFFQLPAHL